MHRTSLSWCHIPAALLCLCYCLCPPICPVPRPQAAVPATHCQGCRASGCLARGRWSPRAGRSGLKRRDAANARRPPGAGSCAVSAECLVSPRRRAPVPAIATPGPAIGGCAWPRAPLAAGSRFPASIHGSAIARSASRATDPAAPRRPIGSFGGGASARGGGSGCGAGLWSGSRPMRLLRGRGQAAGGGTTRPLARGGWAALADRGKPSGHCACLSCGVGRAVLLLESPDCSARIAGV